MRNRHSAWRVSGRLLVLAAAVIVAAAACGGTATRPGPSPSTLPVPTPTPAPTFQALVGGVEKGIAGPIDLYDSTAGTRTLQVRGTFFRFAGQGRISYLGDNGALYSQSLDGTARRTEVSGNVLEYGWGSDGTLAYVTSTKPGAPDDRGQLVIRPVSGQAATADLGAGIAYVGIPQRAIAFSPDGKLVMVAQVTFGSNLLSVHRLDGTLQFAPQGTHGAWAPDGRLYYASDTGIVVADPATGTTKTVVSGVRWYNPTVSPDGRYVVFERQPVATGQPTALSSPPWLELLDTRTGTIVSGFRLDGGISAHFVAPARFWFQIVVPQDSPAARPVLTYDLTTRTEGQTGLTGTVWDVRLGNAS